MDACIGEIRMFAFAWAPVGWARCDGTLLNVQDYSALFNVLGTQYGGDGDKTFALPDLRGRTPVHAGAATDDGSAVQHGESGGQYEVVLTLEQIAPHDHELRVFQSAPSVAQNPTQRAADAGAWQIQTAATQHATFLTGPVDAVAGHAASGSQHGTDDQNAHNTGDSADHLQSRLESSSQNNLPWAVETTSVSGQGAAHPNMQPSQVISFCIALQDSVADETPPQAATGTAGYAPSAAPAGAAGRDGSVPQIPDNTSAAAHGAEQTTGAVSHFLGEIRLFAGDTVPEGWLSCDGRRLSVEEHDTLYSLLGNWFGGDGIHDFALPDLRGRVPVHDGKGPKGMPPLRVGTRLGSETVALTSDQMPEHRHSLTAGASLSGDADGAKAAASAESGAGAGSRERVSGEGAIAPLGYQPAETTSQVTVTLHPETLAQSGLSDAHDNMMPSISLQYAIAVTGRHPPEP